MMDLLHLVDRLEELAANAQKMPIGSRAIIDRRRLLDIVDQMRIVVPQEVREASELVANRDELRREADEEARMIVARAEEQADRLVEEHEITRAARSRATELAKQAGERLEERIAEANADVQERLAESRRLADQQMSGADEYSRDLLLRLERQLEAFVGSVRSGLAQLGADAATGSRDETAAGIHDASATDKAIDDVIADTTEAGGEQPVPVGARVQAPALESSATPIPLHPASDAPDELENLLRQPLGTGSPVTAASPQPAADDVIDDFILPRLDDEPTHQAGEEEEPERGR